MTVRLPFLRRTLLAPTTLIEANVLKNPDGTCPAGSHIVDGLVCVLDNSTTPTTSTIPAEVPKKPEHVQRDM